MTPVNSDQLHAWLAQVSYQDLRLLAYGLRINLPAEQAFPAARHIIDCQHRIVNQSNGRIDPSRWHLMLRCRYPPFDNIIDSSPIATDFPQWVYTAPSTTFAQPCVVPILPTSLHISSASCAKPLQTADEIQVDGLLVVEEDVSSGTEQDEEDEQEIDWMEIMIGFDDAKDCLTGEIEAETDVTTAVSREEYQGGPPELAILVTPETLQHELFVVPVTSTSAPIKPKRKVATASYHNFRAVTQAHQEMVKRETMRRSRNPRSQSTSTSSDNPIIAMTARDDSTILSEEESAPEGSLKPPATLSTQISSEVVKERTPDCTATTEPLSVTSKPYNLRPRSNKVGKGAIPSFRPRFQGKSLSEYTDVLAAHKDAKIRAREDSAKLPTSKTNTEILHEADAQTPSTRSGTIEMIQSDIDSHELATSIVPTCTTVADAVTKGNRSINAPTATSPQTIKAVEEEYAPFNTTSSTNQRKKPITVSRTALGMPKRLDSSKSGEANGYKNRSPLQEKSLNTMDSVKVDSGSIELAKEEKHSQVSEQIQPVVNLKRKRKSLSTSSIDENSQSAIPVAKRLKQGRADTTDCSDPTGRKPVRVAKSIKKKLDGKKAPKASAGLHTIIQSQTTAPLPTSETSAFQVVPGSTVPPCKSQQREFIFATPRAIAGTSYNDVCPASHVQQEESEPIAEYKAAHQTEREEETEGVVVGQDLGDLALKAEYASVAKHSLNLGEKKSAATKTKALTGNKLTDRPSRVFLGKKQREAPIAEKDSAKAALPSQEVDHNLIKDFSVTAAAIARTSWEACTGSFLPDLNSIIPDDQDSPSGSDNSQVSVSTWINRLDQWLAMPEHEVVWPTLASVELSSYTPTSPNNDNAHSQEQDGNNLTDTMFALAEEDVTASNYDKSDEPENSRHPVAADSMLDVEGGCSDESESGSDHTMDVDEDDFRQTSSSASEVSLMEVDEEVDPIPNEISKAVRYPVLDREWAQGVPQKVYSKYFGRQKSGWESSRVLGQLRKHVTTRNAINFACDYKRSIEMSE